MNNKKNTDKNAFVVILAVFGMLGILAGASIAGSTTGSHPAIPLNNVTGLVTIVNGTVNVTSTANYTTAACSSNSTIFKNSSAVCGPWSIQLASVVIHKNITSANFRVYYNNIIATPLTIRVGQTVTLMPMNTSIAPLVIHLFAANRLSVSGNYTHPASASISLASP
ncbi:MAG: hypothetical protein ACHQX1_01760 [Candidatus Micrarchaeales archaeon]